MALNDLTRSAVTTALQEFDRLGREQFLQRYGFQPARTHHVYVAGRHYDSKAIAGAAHQFVGNGIPPLLPSEFSGGEATVARVLRRLGFEVVRITAPAVPLPSLKAGRVYSWDEL